MKRQPKEVKTVDGLPPVTGIEGKEELLGEESGELTKRPKRKGVKRQEPQQTIDTGPAS